MLLSQLIYEGGGPCLARQVMHRVGLPDNGTVTPLTRSLLLYNGYGRHITPPLKEARPRVLKRNAKLTTSAVFYFLRDLRYPACVTGLSLLLVASSPLPSSHAFNQLSSRSGGPALSG